MHIVHLQNIEKNGRIVICNGGQEIFFLCFLHYNDTCKVNQQFTGGERKVVKLNIQTAELALREASESNPGAWADHSRFVAEACKNIASHCKDLSSEQAYIFGLLHDIGRYAGVSSERHLMDAIGTVWSADGKKLHRYVYPTHL